MNAVELKRSLSIDDVIKFVTTYLGSDEPVPDTEAVCFQTICHNPRHTGKHKLYYYNDSQMFHCYTDSCGTFDIYELIQKAGYANDFIGAYQVLCDFFGYNPFGSNFEEEPEKELTADWDIFVKLDTITKKEEKRKSKETVFLSPNILELFPRGVPDIWYQEGISIKAMQKFGIRVDPSANRIIIPHYDYLGQLIGIRSRNLGEYELNEGYKYTPVKIEETWYNHPLGDHLYGLNFNKEAIQRAKQVVIFESEKSVLLSETYYPENNFTVAVCGANLGDKQINLLLSLGVNEVIIAFDKECDGILASNSTQGYKAKLEKIAQAFSPYVNTYIVLDTYDKLEHKDSPADRGKETLEFLLKKKIFIPSTASVYEIEKKRKTK